MESSLLIDRIGIDLPDPGFSLRLIFLGLCTAIGVGLFIPGIVLAHNGWKERSEAAMIPGAILLPCALVCFICTLYLFIRWTRQQLHMYHRVRQEQNNGVDLEG